MNTKHNIDITTHKQIMYLATILPLVWVMSHEKHYMTKEELDEMGYVGAQDLGNGTHVYRAPVMIAKNHYRCMRRRFMRHGAKGLEKYIDEIKKLQDA